MVKIYTHYSDSHKELYENFFKKSLRSLYSNNDVAIRYMHHTQTTHDGTFMTQGWLDSMSFKLDVILSAIEENKEGWFIFADCDIQFLSRFVEDLESQLTDVDLVCQEDCGSMCAGFFACKGTPAAKNLFETIKKTFRLLVNDQVALNEHQKLISYKLLDNKKYYTIGNYFKNIDGTHNWDNTTNIIPPREVLVHHANYVCGVQNKVKLLTMIRSNYENLV